VQKPTSVWPEGLNGVTLSTVKLLLAIVCSFVLAGAPLLLARTSPPVCAKHSMPACCRHGGTMPCCNAKPPSNSQPLPAVPTQSGSQSQLSFLAPAVLIWTLPANPANLISSLALPFSTAIGAPLYARNCARLI
jgi:hypothetical protein